MESKFKRIIFWISFALFLFCIFIAIFSFLTKNVAGAQLFLAFAFIFAGLLFLMKKKVVKGIVFLIVAMVFLAFGFNQNNK